ncbi:MAG TPA: DNA polymerase IV [Bacillota bacterium]|nr:DNA polymerase IV [Bacillota bacterium]
MAEMFIDCDAFFASCEQAINPSLKGKPVAVVGSADSTQRGVVTAKSREAKKLGITTGMPYFQAKKLAPSAFFIRGKPHVYLDFSRKLHEKLVTYGQYVHPCSIDEFHVSCPEGYERAVTVAKDFRAWTKKRLGITVTAGVADTRVLAKLASDMGKPDGLKVIPPDGISREIDGLPVDDLPGIGYRTAATLAKRGVHTLGQLRAFPKELLRPIMGVRADWLYDSIEGREPAFGWGVPFKTKSMSNDFTILQETADEEVIKAHLLMIADGLAARLAAEKTAARTAHIHLRYADFNDVGGSYTIGYDMTITDHIMDALLHLYAKVYTPGRPIRLVGAGVSGLTKEIQLRLPLDEQSDTGARIRKVLDDMVSRFGTASIRRASVAYSTGLISNMVNPLTAGASISKGI